MPRVKQFNEEEVLQKATELFWKKGYHATSIQDLVDFLGINRASLYDTFGGKEELFQKAFKTYREGNQRRIMEFLRSQPTVKEGILNLYAYNIGETVKDPDHKGCFVVNTTTELTPGDPAIVAQLAQNQAELEKIFYDYLQHGVENGEISKDKDLKSIATLLFTLNNGIQVVAKINPDKKRLLATVKTALSVLD